MNHNLDTTVFLPASAEPFYLACHFATINIFRTMVFSYFREVLEVNLKTDFEETPLS